MSEKKTGFLFVCFCFFCLLVVVFAFVFLVGLLCFVCLFVLLCFVVVVYKFLFVLFCFVIVVLLLLFIHFCLCWFALLLLLLLLFIHFCLCCFALLLLLLLLFINWRNTFTQAVTGSLKSRHDSRMRVEMAEFLAVIKSTQIQHYRSKYDHYDDYGYFRWNKKKKTRTNWLPTFCEDAEKRNKIFKEEEKEKKKKLCVERDTVASSRTSLYQLGSTS